MRRGAVLFALLIIASVGSIGCESPEAKAARLRSEEQTSALELWYETQQHDSLYRELVREKVYGNGVDNRAVLAHLDSASKAAAVKAQAAQAAHDVAQRALNKFMGGR